MTSYEDQVYSIISEKLDKEHDFIKANLEKKLSDLGADSLDMTEMVMDAEDRFNISLPHEEMKTRFQGYPSTRELIGYIKEKKDGRN